MNNTYSDSVPRPIPLIHFNESDIPTYHLDSERTYQLSKIHCDMVARSVVSHCTHSSLDNITKDKSNSLCSPLIPDQAAINVALQELVQITKPISSIDRNAESNNMTSSLLHSPNPISERGLSLSELVQSVSLELSQPNHDLHLIYYYMLNYNSNLDEWQRYALRDSGRKYTRNLIATDNKTFTLMLLCWNPSRGSPIHNHAGSECFMRTIKGNILESQYELDIGDGANNVAATHMEDSNQSQLHYYCSEDSIKTVSSCKNNKLQLKSQCVHSSGHVAFIIDSIGLHKVENIYSEPAVTLHLYIPPYSVCKCYNESTGNSSDTLITFYSEHGEKVDEH